MDSQFEQDGNTLKFKGDLSTLPHCVVCTGKHDLLTQEHPYKMVEEEVVSGQ